MERLLQLLEENARLSVEDLAACPEIDAVYVASPNALHYQHCKTLLEQGKHVICEKPLCSHKAQVEELYRNLGTSFAEAVRIFAQQSLREGGLPFRPALKTWDELTEAEIDEKLSRSDDDITAGRIRSQAELDAHMRERFSRGSHPTV